MKTLQLPLLAILSIGAFGTLEIDKIVEMLVQILIAIATIYKLLIKPKNQK